MGAGARLLADRPIDAIPVNDIVDAAGVAKGSFFNHFDSKDAFAVAVAAGIRDEIEAVVSDANADLEDAAEQVASGMATFLRFALDHPERARVMLRSQDWLTWRPHPVNRGVEAAVALGLANQRFAARAGDIAVLAIVGLCQSLMISFSHDATPFSEARKLAEALLRFTLAGLGVPGPEADAVIGRVLDRTF
jgi:AcrR family transcriptional regulator